MGPEMHEVYAEVVVKQLDPRWARKGVTAALLKQQATARM